MCSVLVGFAQRKLCNVTFNVSSERDEHSRSALKMVRFDCLQRERQKYVCNVRAFVCVCSVRVLPHDQNTGGFFITVFRKVAPVQFRIVNDEFYAEADDEAVTKAST